MVMTALVVGHTCRGGWIAGRYDRTMRRRIAEPAFAAQVSRRRGERAPPQPAGGDAMGGGRGASGRAVVCGGLLTCLTRPETTRKG